MDARTRLQHGFSGPAWHGPCTEEILKGLTAHQAVQRPIPGRHSIAELVAHMTTWREFAIQMLEKNFKYRVEFNSTQDWPVCETLTEPEWHSMLQTLSTTQDRLLQLLADASEADLASLAGDRPFNVDVIVHGVVDHDIYHGSQIGVLRRML